MTLNASPLRLAAALTLLFALGAIAGCSDPDEGSSGPLADLANPEDSEAPLSDFSALLDGAPSNDTLPEEGKTDQVFPDKFDVRDTQSAVKSQGSRGVCSIFSTTALMEHLYIAEGTLPDADFSEQYLQWSAKSQVGQFKNTSGSNANVNLEAINRFGIVTEADYPYNPSPWNSSNDPACKGGDDQPVQCYTQGEPPERAANARKWKLPRSRFIRASTRSIKAYMMEQKVGVVAGMTFFYQGWNHRASALPVNSENWSEGYVLPPNAEDREKSLAKRAGHSILLLGWDDNLTVPKRDKDGNIVKGADGEAELVKGFFLIKNSWGTSGFGIRNAFGAGYGWIAYDYIEEFASVTSTTQPTVELDPEICNDDIDNNLDRRADCEDPQCAADAACNTGAGLTFTSTETLPIPDNTPAGVTTALRVSQTGNVGKVTVSVDVTHSYRGDLIVKLTSPDGTEAILHNKTGAGEDNLIASFTPEEFAGRAIQGDWKLTVIDTAKEDTGRINGWSLEIDLDGNAPAEACDDNLDNDGNGDTDCGDAACAAFPACQGVASLDFANTTAASIPDNDPNGVTSNIEVTDPGQISSMKVSVNITHTFRGDLLVKLTHKQTGTVTILHNKTGDNADNLVQTWSPSEFTGEAVTGTWSLSVSDNGAQDVGQLDSWNLEFDVVPQ